MPVTAPDQAATIRRFYEECLNQCHSGILTELFTPDAVVHAPNGDAVGIPAIEKTLEGVHAMFPDHHFVIDDIIVSGDKAAARWTMTSTHTAPIAGIPPTGRALTQRAIVFYRFAEDRIDEVWLQLDQVGILRQIGVPIPGGPPQNSNPKN